MSGAQPVVRCPEMPRSNSLFGGANLVSRGGPCVAVDPLHAPRACGGGGGGGGAVGVVLSGSASATVSCLILIL